MDSMSINTGANDNNVYINVCLYEGGVNCLHYRYQEPLLIGIIVLQCQSPRLKLFLNNLLESEELIDASNHLSDL